MRRLRAWRNLSSTFSSSFWCKRTPKSIPLLQQWSRDRALPLSIRAFVLHTQERLGMPGDTEYRQALWRTEEALSTLRDIAPPPLTDTGELLPLWRDTILNLLLALALDLAHALKPRSH